MNEASHPHGSACSPAEHSALEMLGLLLVEAGQWDDARSVWEGLAFLTPADYVPMVVLASIAMQQGHWQQAAELAAEAIARAPGESLPHRARAEALLHFGCVPESRRRLLDRRWPTD
ncbi:MAG: tetratricopeptide repeat protein [Pseudomonadota bacterium]